MGFTRGHTQWRVDAAVVSNPAFRGRFNLSPAQFSASAAAGGFFRALVPHWSARARPAWSAPAATDTLALNEESPSQPADDKDQGLADPI